MTRISSAGPCQHSWLSVPAHQRDWSDRRGHAASRQTLGPCSKTMISSVSTSPLAGALPSVVDGWQKSIFLPKNRHLCLVSNDYTTEFKKVCLARDNSSNLVDRKKSGLLEWNENKEGSMENQQVCRPSTKRLR
jgi:hypothetical protein